MVSLFLILLSFFILLNSISLKNKKKSEEVLTNVRYEFVGKDLKTKLSINNKDDIAAGSKIFGLKERMEDILRKKLSSGVYIIQSGKLLKIHLRNNVFFNDESGNIKYSGEKILRQIFSLIQEYSETENINADISIPNTGNNKIDIKKATIINNISSYYYPSKYRLTVSHFKTEKDLDNAIKISVVLGYE
ncbi:MAG: hypothetical protein SFT90_07175 [Rickettsiales bacterium]|nr:hypothetical protein [Rickettsiales bacterium]